MNWLHTIRGMAGVRNPVTLKGTSLKDYTDEEEFFAIVVTNVYISSKGSNQLREDDDGHKPLRAPYNTSAGFLTFPGAEPLLRKQAEQMRYLWYGLIGLAGARFNPFRELKP